MSISLIKPTSISTVLLIILISIIVVITVSASGGDSNAFNDFENSRTALSLSSYGWTSDLIQSFDEKHFWLNQHGLRIEIELFEKIGTAIFSSASLLRFNLEDAGFLSSSFVNLHFVFLRIVFFILAAWRLWLLCGILGFLYAKTKIYAYKGRDLLGETGSGRIFDSAITLPSVVPSSTIPQVTGLACPHSVSEEIWQKSEIFSLLEEYGISNETICELLGIVLYYDSLPCFLVDKEIAESIDESWINLRLSEYAIIWLRAALRLQASWIRDEEINVDQEDALETLVRASLDGVQSQELKAEIAKSHPELIVCLVLAHFAAKPLVFEQEGQKWIKKSQFPELAARSILHSLPTFYSNFDSNEQKLLRQALVFARQADLAPMVIPKDISPQAKALRNWSELILSNPSMLEISANRIELSSLTNDLFLRCSAAVFESIKSKDEELLDLSFVTSDDILLVPTKILIDLFLTDISPEELEYFENLHELVYGKIVKSSPLENSSKTLLQPLDFLEIKELSRSHKLSEDILKKWSTFRLILNHYGLLARRIRDNVVPNSYLVFADLNTQNKSAVASNKFFDQGLVALKTSQSKVEFGKDWNRLSSSDISTICKASNELLEKGSA